jgi:hypothetical protein
VSDSIKVLVLVLFALMQAMLTRDRRLSSPAMKATRSIAVVALACLLVGLVSCTMAPQASGPRATVDRFLDFYFHEYGSGLPDAAQRATLRPLLSDDLTGALESAAAAERCASEQARGQEPPLIQGDIFSSLFEKATAVVGIDQGPTDGRRLSSRLHFEWREPGAAEASVTWTDEVTLQAVDGRWLIDDFVHGGDWQFTVKGSMKKMLLDVAALCSSPRR